MQLMPDTLADVRTGHVTLMNFSKEECVPVLIFPPNTIRNQMLRKLAQNSVWRRYEMPIDETLPLNKYRLKHIVEKPANPKSHLVIANVFIPHNTIVKLHDTPQPKDEKQLQNMTADMLNVFRSEIYHRYQMHWMLTHNYSLHDLFLELTCYTEEQQIEDDSYQPRYAWTDWQNEQGFSGSLWACMDEFKTHEHWIKDYVKHNLLSDNPTDSFWYEKDLEQLQNQS